MLRCWAAICWRLVARSQVQMALYVLLGSTAYSIKALNSAGDMTIRSGDTCERNLPLQAKHSDTTKVASWTHHTRVGWKICFWQCRARTIQMACAAQQAAAKKKNWEQRLSSYFVTQAPAWTWLANIQRWMLFRKEELGPMQRAYTDTNTTVESQQTAEN